MKITFEYDENGRRILQIEADWDELAADYYDIVTGFARVHLPGFRPGKVPRSVIEQRFQREVVKDLSQRAAQRLGREAIREAGVESLGPVEATDIECEKGKTFRFKARYLPMPEITLPDLRTLTKELLRSPSPPPSPSRGEGSNISPPLRGGDEGDGEVCDFPAGCVREISEDSMDPRDHVSHRLLELVPFEVPGTLVREEMGRDGLDTSLPGSEEWNAAAERIRLMLILKKIARAEGIQVDETDVDQRIREKADEFGTKPETLRAELEKGGGLQRLKDMLLAESTLEYLMERTRMSSVEE